jgi:hypothetical protein
VWSRSAACDDDALAEAGERAQSRAALADFVNDASGFAVAGRFVEVGQQLLAPARDAGGEGVEGGNAGAAGREQKGIQALLGAGAPAAADRSR